MNMDDLSSFAAEILARETAESCYFRVRAGPKTASMTTIESEIAVPDTVDEAVATITDALSRACADPGNKIAYVEAIDRSAQNAVVKRLPIRLDDDEEQTLKLVAAKGSDPAGVLAIQLVRMAEGSERRFGVLLEKYFALTGKFTEIMISQTELITDATVRNEVADKMAAADTKAQVMGMIQSMAPAMNLAIGKALGIPYEQIVAMMGGAPVTGAEEPAAPVNGPDASEGTPDDIADRTVDRLIWLVAEHPETLTEARLLKAKPAIMSIIMGQTKPKAEPPPEAPAGGAK